MFRPAGGLRFRWHVPGRRRRWHYSFSNVDENDRRSVPRRGVRLCSIVCVDAEFATGMLSVSAAVGFGLFPTMHACLLRHNLRRDQRHGAGPTIKRQLKVVLSERHMLL